MKRLALVTAALVAAVAVFITATIPPRRQQLPPSTDGTVAGILHVHSNRSDGLSSPDEIAQAAARAGLRFVVFTDHGDATRLPDPPAYHAGVLCLDAVEISTNGGHYVAIGMSPAPYPLGGEARAVVEDVRRLGGFGVVAHPDSPKPQLRWRDWTASFDGIEMVNLDTVWRRWVLQARTPSAPDSGLPTPWAARRRILSALFDYPFRSPETIASLIQPSTIVNDWAAQAEQRRIVTLAGADAHAKLALRGDPVDNQYVLALPGYESAFRTMSLHVALERPLSGDPAADAPALVKALRDGHLYSAIDGLATPPSLEFTASNRLGTAAEGDELGVGGPVTLRVRSNAPSGFTTTLWNGATALSADRHEPDFTIAAGEGPGVYWIEIRSDRPEHISWIRSNPIYVRDLARRTSAPVRRAEAITQALFDGTSIAGWSAEHDPTSLAVVETAPVIGGQELRLRFGLAGGAPAGQVVTLVRDLPDGVVSHDRVTFTVRGERPMRVAVQLRGGVGDSNNERWQQSVYVDTTDQERTVYFADLLPVGPTHSAQPPLDRVRALLFTLDMTNTKPGTSSRLWLKRVVLQH